MPFLYKYFPIKNFADIDRSESVCVREINKKREIKKYKMQAEDLQTNTAQLEN